MLLLLLTESTTVLEYVWVVAIPCYSVCIVRVLYCTVLLYYAILYCTVPYRSGVGWSVCSGVREWRVYSVQ